MEIDREEVGGLHSDERASGVWFKFRPIHQFGSDQLDSFGTQVLRKLNEPVD